MRNGRADEPELLATKSTKTFGAGGRVRRAAKLHQVWEPLKTLKNPEKP
jgi:hypothetical protein